MDARKFYIRNTAYIQWPHEGEYLYYQLTEQWIRLQEREVAWLLQCQDMWIMSCLLPTDAWSIQAELENCAEQLLKAFQERYPLQGCVVKLNKAYYGVVRIKNVDIWIYLDVVRNVWKWDMTPQQENGIHARYKKNLTQSYWVQHVIYQWHGNQKRKKKWALTNRTFLKPRKKKCLRMFNGRIIHYLNN